LAGVLALALVVALARPVRADRGLFDWGWQAPLDRASAWQAQPGWLNNADTGAKASRDGDALRFRVPTPGKGMKWSLPGVNAAIADAPYLLLEYRAEGLRTTSTDYFVFIDDGGTKETRAVQLDALVADGAWHQLVCDLRTVAESPSFSAVAIQVQAAADKPASVWVRALRQMADGPVAAAGQAAVADMLLPITASKAADWQARPAWLSNPDGTPTSAVEDGTVRLAVAQVGKGMKWAWYLPQDVDLKGHTYLSLRYRATGVSRGGDYTLALLASAAANGRDYARALLPADLQLDGLWHVAYLDLASVSRDVPRIRGVALQIQAQADNASLEIREIGLLAQRPVERATDWFAKEPPAETKDLLPLALPAQGRATLADVLHGLHVADWPAGRKAWGDIPFDLPATSARLPVTGILERSETEFPVDKACSQVFALTLVMLRGAEEPVYARDAKLTEIREIDRFRARLDYADGSSESCVPINVTHGGFLLRDGAQVLCFFAEPTKVLQRIVLTDNSPGMGLAVAATTACTGARLVPDPDEDIPLFQTRPLQQHQLSPIVSASRSLATVRLPLGTMQLALCPLPRLVRLHNDVAGDSLLENGESAPLFRLRLDGEPVPAENFQLDKTASHTVDGVTDLRLRYVGKEPVPLTFELVLSPNRDSELGILGATLTNNDGKPHRLAIEGPFVGPFQPGEKPADTYYLFPRVGACLHNRDTYRRDRYGGRFPVQFMTAFSPAANSGFYLRTAGHLEMRDYALGKNQDGVTFEVHYPFDAPAEPGKSVVLPQTWLGFSEGDWHRAFSAYQRGIASHYHLLSAPQPWFLETFNFRQRFLHSHDPLYDGATGRYRLTDAITEGKDAFGGIEYLHLFDWGNVPGIGRVYGRTGDDSPFDGTLKGGTTAFREAISEVQRQGVHVGLYIEGYLLQQNGKLGQAHGAEWQIIQRNGTPMFWPGSTEMMICPAVREWRGIQASTYGTRVRELQVDGMYMDQFGFANPAKDCWSTKHGHEVPAYTVESEYGYSRLIREKLSATRPGVVLYSEEVPCDVNSQNQDGAFSYHMRNCRTTRPLVPLHVPRFTYPWLKTFEILVCDRPMGGWTEGVEWTFFNGEGIWLEGPGDSWFRPETLATIRKCHAILRAQRDAFSSLTVAALVDTGVPGIYANRFQKGHKTVYTLYNARHRTFRGTIQGPRMEQVLRVRDLWNEREVTPERDGLKARFPVELAPRGVGCLLVIH
jgi:hypothetical protein